MFTGSRLNIAGKRDRGRKERGDFDRLKGSEGGTPENGSAFWDVEAGRRVKFAVLVMSPLPRKKGKRNRTRIVGETGWAARGPFISRFKEDMNQVISS